MTDQEVRDVVKRVLTREFPSNAFLGADVAFENDFDGEPVIRVTAHFDSRPGGNLTEAVHALRTALLEHGDERFVFVTNDIASERQVEEDAD